MYRYANAPLGQDAPTAIEADPSAYVQDMKISFSSMSLEAALSSLVNYAGRVNVALSGVIAKEPLYVTTAQLTSAVTGVAKVYAGHAAIVELANEAKIDLERTFPSLHRELNSALAGLDKKLPSLSKFDPSIADQFTQFSGAEIEQIIYQGDLDSLFVPKSVKLNVIRAAYSGQLSEEVAANIISKYEASGAKKGGAFPGWMLGVVAGAVAFFALR